MTSDKEQQEDDRPWLLVRLEDRALDYDLEVTRPPPARLFWSLAAAMLGRANLTGPTFRYCLIEISAFDTAENEPSDIS